MFRKWQWYVFTLICMIGVYFGITESDETILLFAALGIWLVGSGIWLYHEGV